MGISADMGLKRAAANAEARSYLFNRVQESNFFSRHFKDPWVTFTDFWPNLVGD